MRAFAGIVMSGIFAVLVACGGGEAYDTFSYDEMAPSGLRVRYANDRPPRLAKIDSLYAEVSACMGLSPMPRGPLIVIEDNLIAKAGHDAMFMQPDLIRIDSQITTFENPDVMPPFPFKHEMVHFLLYISSGNPDSDHLSPFFDTCGH